MKGFVAEVLAETEHVVIEGNGSKKIDNNGNLEIMGNFGDSKTGDIITMLKCDYEFGNTNVCALIFAFLIYNHWRKQIEDAQLALSTNTLVLMCISTSQF